VNSDERRREGLRYARTRALFLENTIDRVENLLRFDHRQAPEVTRRAHALIARTARKLPCIDRLG
jgi:hypothetical protein